MRPPSHVSPALTIRLVGVRHWAEKVEPLADRVHAPAQKGAHWYVGYQMAADRRLERGGDVLRSVDGRAIVTTEVDVPVPLQPERLALERELVCRRKLAHPQERRPRQRNEAEREIVIDGRQVEAEGAAPAGQEGLQFGAEGELPGGGIEW